jgi:hypothetical protein
MDDLRAGGAKSVVAPDDYHAIFIIDILKFYDF